MRSRLRFAVPRAFLEVSVLVFVVGCQPSAKKVCEKRLALAREWPTSSAASTPALSGMPLFPHETDMAACLRVEAARHDPHNAQLNQTRAKCVLFASNLMEERGCP